MLAGRLSRRSLPPPRLAADAQPERLDLPLPVAPAVDGARGRDGVADARERMRSQAALDVDHGDAGPGDRLLAGEHEVGVAVAIRVDGLDVDDPPARGAAAGRREIGRASCRERV